MLGKYEALGIGISVIFMALALYLIRIETSILGNSNVPAQSAALSEVVVVANGENVNQNRADALISAADNRGNILKLVIDDIKIGTGDEVKEGSTVVVHYIGTLQNGAEFDNSNKRGQPFTFKVGAGMVIKGWEQGLLGMKVGGQRVLVVPPELAYGSRKVGPIPPNSTLVFAIELLEVK